MNLAWWKYRNLVGVGKPIEKVSVRLVNSVLGDSYFESYSFLSPKLIPETYKPSILYGDCSGTGSAHSKLTSVFKSISESLERWAYFDASRSMPNLYGFSEDYSTSGFSAFPGFSGRVARLNSKCEAFERWSLLSWWNGDLAIAKLQPLRTVDGIEIEIFQLASDDEMVAVLVCLNASGRIGESIWAYGFAAAATLSVAIQKALIEMERNLRILLVKTRSDFGAIESIQDARLLYFSTMKGNELFRSKIREGLSRHGSGKKPKLIFDDEIKGPWSKYATVWRILYEMPFSSADLEIFYF
jgi:hypothetical protein